MPDTPQELNETLFMTDEDVRTSFDWAEASAALRRAYSARSTPGQFPPRTMARHEGCWLRVLSGIEPNAGVMGTKIIAASMKAGAVSYLIPLYDLRTMALLCLMDANAITGFRTAATTALALDILANPDARRVAVIGSGFEAKTHVRALAAIRPLDLVTVYSPRPESRVRFIEELSDLGIPMEAADSAEGAVEDAGIVLCAARSRDETPTLRGAWLKSGVTVASIGSTLQEQREVDPETIAAAALIVADMPHEVADETGDMLAATAAGVQFADRLIALEELVSGAHPGRADPGQIILYKSVGSAIQDIVVAAMCFGRSRELGLGTPMPATIVPIHKGK